MSWTNIRIKDRFSTTSLLMDKNRELEFKVKLLYDEKKQLEAKLQIAIDLIQDIYDENNDILINQMIEDFNKKLTDDKEK